MAATEKVHTHTASTRKPVVASTSRKRHATSDGDDNRGSSKRPCVPTASSGTTWYNGGHIHMSESKQTYRVFVRSSDRVDFLVRWGKARWEGEGLKSLARQDRRCAMIVLALFLRCNTSSMWGMLRWQDNIHKEHSGSINISVVTRSLKFVSGDAHVVEL